MKNLSAAAKLSFLYTNHSIRTTTNTILDKNGFEARHIMAVSGHKSESSIRSYASTSMNTKRKMSETLSIDLNDKKRSAIFPITDGNSSTLTPVHHEIVPVSTPSTKRMVEPLLTDSQEQQILNELSIQQSQQTIQQLLQL